MVTSLLPHHFSVELLAVLSGFTNVYFGKKLLKSSYSASWGPITVEEFCNSIALLFYMSIVTDPNVSAYWLNHPFSVGYGATILCPRVNINR